MGNLSSLAHSIMCIVLINNSVKHAIFL